MTPEEYLKFIAEQGQAEQSLTPTQEEETGVIREPTWEEAHPFLTGLKHLMGEVSGVYPSQRLYRGLTEGPSVMATPWEKADYAAGIMANGLETALAGVDVAAITGATQKALRNVPWEELATVSRRTLASERGLLGGPQAIDPPFGLQKAKDLDELDWGTERIWHETGWIKGPEGKWRFEIDDSVGKFTPSFVSAAEAGKVHPGGINAGRWRLGDVLDHPKLYKHYPGFENMRVYFRDLGSTLGSIQAGPDGPYIAIHSKLIHPRSMKKAKRTLLHELQHGIQSYEGFASGGSPALFRYLGHDLIGEAEDAYRRLAGEIEAREVESRAWMPQRTREEFLPYTGIEARAYPREQWIIRKEQPMFAADDPVIKMASVEEGKRYYISTGRKDASYTLRVKYPDKGPGGIVYDRDDYVMVLGPNWEKAVERAEKYTKGKGPLIAEKGKELAPFAPKRAAEEFKFGKYAGKTIDEVDDPEYIQWMWQQDWFRKRPKFKTFRKALEERGLGPSKFTEELIEAETEFHRLESAYAETRGQDPALKEQYYAAGDRLRELRRRARTETHAIAGGLAGIERDEEGNITLDPTKFALGVAGAAAIAGISKPIMRGRGRGRTMTFEHFDPMPEARKTPAIYKTLLHTQANPMNHNLAAAQVAAHYTARQRMSLRTTEHMFMESLNRSEEGFTLFDNAWLAEVERRKKNWFRDDYKPYVETRTGVSAKQAASGNIKAGDEYLPMDTSRGCVGFCPECYAFGSATKSCKNFIIPTKVELTGDFFTNPNQIRRFGEVGDPNIDPNVFNDVVLKEWSKAVESGEALSVDRVADLVEQAYDWKHTNTQLRKVNLDHPDAHSKVFVITKLQSIKNFDPSVVRNLEVSVDPLIPRHFFKSLQNVQALKELDPTLNIMLRIRSHSTFSDEVNSLQKIAVEFANRNNVPVLETRLRFKRAEGLKAAQVQSDYVRKGNQFYHSSYQALNAKEAERISPLSHMGIRKELHYVCDRKNIAAGGACGSCQNCRRFLQLGKKNAKAAEVARRKQQTAGIGLNEILAPLTETERAIMNF